MVHPNQGFSYPATVGVFASEHQGCLPHRWREDEERKLEGEKEEAEAMRRSYGKRRASSEG